MPIKINTFDPHAKTHENVVDLHQKLDELHGKFDALLSLLTPKTDEAGSKNEQDKA